MIYRHVYYCKKPKGSICLLESKQILSFAFTQQHRNRRSPANTGNSPNAVSILAHRLRRWPNIETALGECSVFAGEVVAERAFTPNTIFT